MKAMFPRWIPTGATEVRPDPPDVEAVVYCYFTAGGYPPHSPALVAYSGKRTKPDAHQAFRDEAQRAEAIQEYFDGLRAWAKTRAEWKAERNKPTTLKVGDILSYSWGYDQTNTEFYEVLEVKGQRVVIIQEVGQKSAGGEGFMSGQVIPNGNRLGKPMRKVASGDGVPMEFGTASKWDGRPEYWSGYA